MAYGQFASVYDQLMKHAPYEKWTNFTTDILKKYDVPARKIVELGCGTGELAIRLAEKGYALIGIDQSTDMLTVASSKALAKSIDIQWIKQDIRELSGFMDIKVFISYCDVLNYITDINDLQTVFERVYESLAVGGLFVFDFHSINYAENTLMNETFSEITDDLTYIWECEQGEKAGEMFHYLTFFEKDQDCYHRFDESHHQQTYSINIYKELLRKSKFSEITFYCDFLIENAFSEKDSERIFAVAKK